MIRLIDNAPATHVSATKEISMPSSRRRSAVLVTLAMLLGLALAVGPADAAEPAPAWMIDSQAQPTNFTPGDSSGEARYVVQATNIGAKETDGSQITIADTLPAGVTAQSIQLYWSSFSDEFTDIGAFLCNPATVSCTIPGGFFATAPGGYLRMVVRVAVDAGASGPVVNTATVSGGGAAPATASGQNAISATPAPFGIAQLHNHITGADGKPETQAGAHPYQLTTKISLANKIYSPAGMPMSPLPHASEDPKNIVVDLPLGLLGSAQAAPTCSQAQLTAVDDDYTEGCPEATVVGHIRSRPHGDSAVNGPLWNMVPEKGETAAFGFRDFTLGSHVLYARVAPTPEGYVLRTTSPDIPQVALTDVTTTFFGNPAARNGSGQSPTAMFTNPTDCSAGALTMRMYMDSWQNPGRKLADGNPDLSDPNWVSASTTTPEVEGCNKLRFDSELRARPHTTIADSPSGIDVTIEVPQSTDPDVLATPPLKKGVVRLPEGLTVNPGSADGLGACSPAQIDLGSAASPACPESSKIGTVELETPLIAGTLEGSIYLASQNDNPFNTLLAAYIVVDDADTGIVIKIPGKMEPDPQTGRLTGIFDNNPQFPFSELRLKFKGGPRGVLATPNSCGTFLTMAEFTPWSAPDSGPASTPSDPFSIDSGCVSGFKPSFTAGSQSTRAGASSPFTMSFARSDTDEEISGLKATLPEGLLAKLAGVARCSDTDAATGVCPAASQVGSVMTGSGPGANPLFLPGKAFLTGSYKGAPLGLAVAVPAKAGPFDLGTVVVRQALHVDSTDASVTAVSDRFPTILQGIPLRLRRVDVAFDRAGFMRNPTSCEPMSVGATLTSLPGSHAPVSSRFQVGDCAALAFKPKLALRLTGRKQTRTGRHPGVRAKVTQTRGQAAISKAVVKLPKALALDPDNAGALCEFEDGTKADLENHCPKGSIVGRAKATTPLLDKPLAGDVYFVKNVRTTKAGNKIRTLPMIVVALRGEIDLNLTGKSSTSKDGRLVNTFATVPDAPVTKFNLNIAGGKNGILTVTRTARAKINLCTSRHTAEVDMNGHNGKQRDFTTRVKTPCKATKKAGRRGR